MIKAHNEQVLKDAFKGRIPFFECKEVDPYTGEITLSDHIECDHETNVTLWIMGDGDYFVSVSKPGGPCTDDAFDDIDSALAAYERRMSENHDEQESGQVDDELVERCAKIVALKHALYEILCKDGNLTMAIEYLTAYTHTLIMACEITGLPESYISKRVKEYEECLRTPF